MGGFVNKGVLTTLESMVILYKYGDVHQQMHRESSL